MHAKVHKPSSSSTFRTFKPSKLETFNLQPEKLSNFQSIEFERPGSGHHSIFQGLRYFGRSDAVKLALQASLLPDPRSFSVCRALLNSGLTGSKYGQLQWKENRVSVRHIGSLRVLGILRPLCEDSLGPKRRV